MIRKAATKKSIAVFFLGLMTLETLLPLKGLALTSGPAQPEMTQFQPAGMSDMVDLFTGDFKYNLPLLDVDGYPVNLSYAQGAGMEDEASWVGLGWNLNVGAVNRQLRGVPDDHNGDRVTTKYHMKKKVTTGAKVSGRLELTGWEVLKVGGSVSAGLFYDNYTGYGAEAGYGYNAGLSLSSSNAGSLTVGLRSDVSSNTASGVSKTLGASLSIGSKMNDYGSNSIGANISQSYNSREGMKSLTLGVSYGNTSGKAGLSSSATFELNTPVFYPSAQIPFKSASHTFSVDLGVTAYLVSLGAGFSGYRSSREVKQPVMAHMAYGSLYGANAKNNGEALMDFMREKDNIVVPDMQHIALPVATPDNFTYSSQAGGGQFKVYNGGSGVFFNNRKIDDSRNSSFGSDFGIGALFHGGVSRYNQQVEDISQKWENDNGFLANGDFPAPATVDEEQAYFKSIGENTMENETFASRINGEEPVRVPVYQKSAGSRLQKSDNSLVPDGQYKRPGRQIRNNTIQYLTASQASKGGMNIKIPNYPLLDVNTFSAQAACNQPFSQIDRVDNNYRLGHHISEISVLGNDGKRLVYDVPVYNNFQQEISFAYKQANGQPVTSRTNNLVPYVKDAAGQIKHKHPGTDEYYNEQRQPAYATSYLLSAILSPDYVDVTNDGITEDDRGTAVKFNYTRLTDNFNWRSPMASTSKMATLNQGNLADPDDDKASIVYGQKELWYLHSIETKTKIAYFITKDREDALGVSGMDGDKKTDAKQRVLKEIRLYSKSDLNTPIKTVYLDHDYSLCPGVPNHTGIGGTGKLTLKSVHFTYGSSKMGENFPYKFKYNATIDGKSGYEIQAADRWGTYKKKEGNPDGMLNDEFPYTRNILPGLHQLSEIELPTGGKIEIEYESDSYRFVQNRQAMEMRTWTQMLDGDNAETTDLIEMKQLVMNNTAGATDLASFREKYLNGGKYLYGKVFVNLTDEPHSDVLKHFDWVPCYAEVTGVQTVADNKIRVTFSGTQVAGKEYNPFVVAAWQRMRLDYPKYAYPGYKNKIPDDQPISAALSALTNAIGNLRELKEDFNEKSVRKRFANKIKLERSFFRVATAEKQGGGARVKTLTTREVWDSGPEEQSIQQYTYTTLGPDGNEVSSGVASYEPSLGGDENPWRLPDPYTQVNRKALNNEYYLEEPFGESLFPSPVVGYSEVKVQNRSGRETAPVSQTGYLQHEFYTAKDFPTEVTTTALDRSEKQRPALASFFGSKSVYELTMSQGYVIRLNDMHGKPKAERVFNQQRKEISATEYHYNSEERGGERRLLNKVDVVDERGVVTKNQVISRELDMIVDMREGETKNSGLAVNVGADVIPILWFIVPVPHFPITSNSDYRLFRSASVVKTVQYFGVPQKIVKKVDGSEITSYNLLFDKNTGVPVVTATENEFNDPVYSVSLPAYWIYKQMGHAYKTADLLLKGMAVDKDGLIDTKYRSFLAPGDEMINLRGLKQRYWAIASNVPSDPCPVRLINKQGVIVKSMSGDFKIIRSGNRNLLGAVAGTITSLNKPFTDTRLNFPENEDLTNLLALDARATLYAEDWGQPPSCKSYACPEGWVLSEDGTRCLEPARRSESNVGYYNATEQVKTFEEIYAKKTEFYDANFYAERDTGFWSSAGGGRFTRNAIWSNRGDNDVWNILKRKLYIEEAKDYWIGFGGDDQIRVYINGGEVYALAVPSAYTSWNMRKIYLHEGYNDIEIMTYNNVGKYGAAFEIYNNSREELLSGVEGVIDVIFDSHRAISEGPYESFNYDAQFNVLKSLYRCAAGDGPPDYQMDGLLPYCNSTPVGECPAGYVRSDDGLNCIKPVAKNLSLAIAAKAYQATPVHMVFAGAKIWDNNLFPDNYETNGQNEFFGIRNTAPHTSRIGPTGVWPNTAVENGGAVEMSFCINLPEAGAYYAGFSSNWGMRFQVNGSPFFGYSGDWYQDSWPAPTRDSVYWQVVKIPVVQGKNNIRIIADVGNFTWNNFSFEIYKNTKNELVSLPLAGIPNIVFKMSDLYTGATIPYNLSVKGAGNVPLQQRYSCNPNIHFNLCEEDASAACATIKLSEAINPYVTGHLGNWLPSEDKVFLTNRKATPKESVDVIRKGGSYARFRPFWQWSPGNQRWEQSTDIDWTTARWITAYDTYSQELENMNALKQYSGTRFGFNGALPLIVGSNAQSRELYAEGFEDYYFNRKCSGFTPCIMDGFDIRRIVDGNFTQWLNADDAHSGNYSLKLASPVKLTMHAFTATHGPGKYLARNAKGEYERAPVKELQLFGFNPVPEKEYIVSIWMKDNQPRTKDLPIQISVDGANLPGTWKANVEGWKLAEYTFKKSVFGSTGMQPMELVISGGTTTLIDDIRIFPKDGQAVTYAYDDKTLRLMAELDANNFATFYEYDEQGRLIRVKKETEKGILTLKESRSTYIKRNINE
ncbi:hypothetical protein [Chitinophaga rhizosphaerae]|uniref:hypothetical protein n=1 Tax=Chitinophaga rhizosphaerae TaxID=1864947 RepID=UPI000F80A1C5|nr:hypothetical protein [Chitinophaga rhizosphaerae]